MIWLSQAMSLLDQIISLKYQRFTPSVCGKDSISFLDVIDIIRKYPAYTSAGWKQNQFYQLIPKQSKKLFF